MERSVGTAVRPGVAGPRVAAQRQAPAATRAVPVVRIHAGWWVAYCMLAFLVALFYVWSHTRFVQSTYVLSRLKHQEKSLTVANEKLRLEIATLRAPGVVSRVATEQLKMVAPEPRQIIMVK